MTYRLVNLSAPLDFDPGQLASLVAKALRLREEQICDPRLCKKSVDARKKHDVHFVLSVDFELAGEPPKHPNLSARAEAPYVIQKSKPLPHRPLVVGLGPAGLMAALALSEAGLNPLVIERGSPVEEREQDVSRFWATGQLNPASNVQFGEGGAGTFSDGKLTTGIKDPRCGHVLRVFHAHGAPDEILYQQKPHIGTDKLPGMVKAIRERIIENGGEVRFGCRLSSLIVENRELRAAVIDGLGQPFETRDLILAVGHSARDTLQMLHNLGVPMRKKPFSIGARIEHPQALIDRAQYGAAAGHPALGASDYKLSERLKNGRGVYTFCMCPGGSVVAAASEPGHLVVNGMSRFARDGANANSAVLVSVEPDDFPGDVLAGLRFQEKWERLAFALGGGRYHAPAQRVDDFLQGVASTSAGDVLPSYRPGVIWTDLSKCLPDFAVESLREGIRLFDGRLRGFASPGAALTGVETRSSSPVTLPRDGRCMSELIGLYPCGEGAGYAGGIMSAAVDGLRCAEAVIGRYA